MAEADSTPEMVRLMEDASVVKLGGYEDKAKTQVREVHVMNGRVVFEKLDEDSDGFLRIRRLVLHLEYSHLKYRISGQLVKTAQLWNTNSTFRQRRPHTVCSRPHTV